MEDRYSYNFVLKKLIYELGSYFNQIHFISKNGSVMSMFFFSS